MLIIKCLCLDISDCFWLFYASKYKYQTDPREQQDVAADHPEIISQMRAKMNEAHEEPLIKRFEIKKKELVNKKN